MMIKGQKINDRYQIIKNIGEGGMANVYLAYDTILDRNVAVKVLRGDLASDEKFVRRFQREALSASSLNHPNIVEVYDVGEDNGQYFIVMEYIEGKHLKEILKKRGQFTVSEVIDIMSQITEGMSVAHGSYIIHRDIKPQNIMILNNGMVKITDFGIAMALNSTQLTQTNSVMGTVHYLPPEQANGKGATIKSDIYSMGILMYELLCGKLPFRGDNAVEIALKHLKEPIPSIKNELPNLPQSIENVILKSTAKNPKNRYNDAREMFEDLKTVMADSRVDEPKYVYPYPEKDMDETKITKLLNKMDEEGNEKEGEEVLAKKITEKDLKRNQNKTLLILGSIFTGLILITTTLVFLIPTLSKKEDVKVPDVVGMTSKEAEKTLTEAGFAIADEPKEDYSSEYEEGLIFKTYPAAGVKVKEGRTITLYVSLGNNEITLEDYTGRNYEVEKARLEAQGINVIIEKQDVDDPTNYEEGEILSQTPEASSKLTEGDTVTFVVPNITLTYPNFLDGNWTLEDIQAFAEEYEINLSVVEVESETEEEGKIISQSKPEGYTIISGSSLTVRVSVKPSVEDLEGELIE